MLLFFVFLFYDNDNFIFATEEKGKIFKDAYMNCFPQKPFSEIQFYFLFPIFPQWMRWLYKNNTIAAIATILYNGWEVRTFIFIMIRRVSYITSSHKADIIYITSIFPVFLLLIPQHIFVSGNG